MLLDRPGLVLALLFVLTVPLAFLGALRFLRRLTDGRWAPMWGAAAYALLPVLTGAVAQGRLGSVAGAVILPWVATAALGLAATGENARVRRWRAAWRTALTGGLLVAFVPTAWLLIVLLVLFAVGGGAARGRVRELVVVTAVPLLLVLPWAVATLTAPGAWLVEAGRAAAIPTDAGTRALLLGRAGGGGDAPAWLGIGLPLAAVVAFLRRDTRLRVLHAWLVVLAAGILLAVESRVPVTLPGVPFEFRPWPGFLLLVVHGGFAVAATLAADGAVRVISGSGFTWRQPVVAVAAVSALAMPVLGAGWWVLHGDTRLLHRAEPGVVPTYMTELAAGRDTGAILLLRGGLRTGIDYDVLRSGPHRLGDDGVLALTPPDPRFQALVERLLSSADPGDAAILASYGVRYVYAPAPVAASISGGLDAAAGFGGASAPARGSRAWVVNEKQTLAGARRLPCRAAAGVGGPRPGSPC